jgi:hypothetical protein
VGVARVGPGANWGQVYGVLDPLNISVVGGRSAEVGVGGVILGGKFQVFVKMFPVQKD